MRTVSLLACLFWLPALAQAQVVSFLQRVVQEQTTSATVAANITYTAGSVALIALKINDQTVTLTSCVDGTNTYTLVTGPSDSTANLTRLLTLRSFSVGAGAVTVTCTFSGTVDELQLTVLEYAKSSGTWAIDATATKTDNVTQTTILFPLVTTTSAAGVVVGIAAFGNLRTMSADATGFTVRTPSATRIGVMDNATVATGTYQPQGIVTSASGSVTATIALKTTVTADPSQAKKFIVIR